MQVQPAMPSAFNRQTVLPRVTATLESLVQDWDLDTSILPETKLVADLGFESIDLIQMVAALEQEFGRPSLPFAELLIVEGRYVDDLSVRQIAEFLAGRL
jgi:acyl carrier protein